MGRHRTIHDLAKESQVSVSTIDRIISGRGHVKTSTIEHVLAAAERIGFYGASSIKSRLEKECPERTFGFVLNGKARKLYGDLASDLSDHIVRSSTVQGKAIIKHLETIDADTTAEALLELGAYCDAVAGICIDHPSTNRAVTELARNNVPFVSMLSDISCFDSAGFVGSNDWQIGRTAGWFMQRLCPPGGKIAVLIGSERYLCQQAQESSFRGFLRAQESRLEVFETMITEENDDIAEQVALSIVRGNPDLAGLLVAGGGMDGVVRALERDGRPGCVVVGTEFTASTHGHLTRGLIDVLLAHPVKEITEHIVESMISLTTQAPPHKRFQHIIPFPVILSENC